LLLRGRPSPKSKPAIGAKKKKKKKGKGGLQGAGEAMIIKVISMIAKCGGHDCKPTLGRLRQEDCKFQASLSYIANLSLVWGT
jgi:hypothetical protein